MPDSPDDHITTVGGRPRLLTSAVLRHRSFFYSVFMVEFCIILYSMLTGPFSKVHDLGPDAIKD